MSNEECRGCMHYRQHYTMDKRRIFRVCCGHCTMGKAKRKRPDAKICEHYISAPVQEEAFVSKEYLSKELLKYILEMELLPKIQQDERMD